MLDRLTTDRAEPPQIGGARPFVSDGLFDYLQYWVTAYEKQGLRNELEGMRIVEWKAVKIVSDMTIPAVKYAMDLNGYYGGPVRLPLLPLTADDKAIVEKLMAKIKTDDLGWNVTTANWTQPARLDPFYAELSR